MPKILENSTSYISSKECEGERTWVCVWGGGGGEGAKRLVGKHPVGV